MIEANLTREEARRRAELISDLEYEVSLDLTTGDETFGCETAIKFRCAEPGAETFVDYTAPEVTSIILNGKELSTGDFDGTRIHLAGLKETNELRIKAKSAYQHTGIGMHRFLDPADDRVYLYTDLEPFECHRVFPCFDQPDLKGTFGFVVNAPRHCVVVSNMPCTGRPPEPEGGWWSFLTTPKISTYVTAVVAGPYSSVHDRHGDIDLGIYCRQSLAEYLDHEEFFEITKQGFDYYHRVFDYPYPFGKYDQVIVPEFNSGAMENVGCVTYNEVYIYRGKATEATRERRAEVILHEMAHMWFGDLVTMRWWDDLWLNESFATFMALMAQDNTRFKNGWVTFANDVKAQARRQDQLPTTHPIAADIPDTQSTRVMFDAISYSKGASALRQLVVWVGEKEFFEGVRNYFRRHEYSNTDLKDFLAALEETSGRDLHAWSKEWLETAGLNTIAAAYQTRDSTYSSFTVVQEASRQLPTLRSHRLAIGLYDGGADGVVKRKGVELDVVGGSTEVPELVGERVPDLLLLNDGDLTYAKIRFDDRSLATVRERLRDLSDALARALCWSAAWEMLQGAELKAGDFLDLVLNNIETESDIGIVQNLLYKPRSTLAGVVIVLLGKVRAVIDFFGDPSRREARLDALWDFLFAAAGRAEPASDHQFEFARALASAAHSAEQLQVLRGFLEGEVPFEGVEIDTELRWIIVRAFAAAGAADEALIAQELERDQTDAGARQASRARAARPKAEAKEAAWEAIVGDPSLSRTAMVEIMAGLQEGRQEELLRPYGEKFFDSLATIWETRTIEVSQAYATYAFPHFVVSEETIAMTDGYLRSKSPAPPIERILLENRDGLVRALNTRRKDAAS